MAKKATTVTVKKGYSPELESLLITLYDGGKGMSAEDIAADPRFEGRPKRSIIGKLVNLDVYVAADKTVKVYKDTGPSKKKILERLEAFGMSEEVRKGLENCTKSALEWAAERLEAAKAVIEANAETEGTPVEETPVEATETVAEAVAA